MTQTPSIAPNTQYPSTARANTDYLNNLGDDSLSPSPSNMNEIFSPSQTNQPSIQPSTSHQPSMSQTPYIAPNTQYPSTATVNKDYLNNLGDDSLSPSPSNMNDTFSPSQTNQPLTQTPAISPSINASFQDTLEDHTSAPLTTVDIIEFVTWDPIEPLQHCQGDCDRDADCAGDMVCFDRAGSPHVPGCVDSSGYVPSISDFCYYEV